MNEDQGDPLRSVALELRESSRGYASELLAENQRLVELLTTFYAANTKLRAELSELQPLRQENVELRELLDALTLAHQKASDELAELRSLAQHEREAVLDRAGRLSEVSQKSRDLSTRFAEVERAGERLASCFIALGRLHEATCAAQVVALLGEVLIHLVGTQRFGIFTSSNDGISLELAASLGVDASAIEGLPVLSGRVAGACRGVAYLRAPGDDPAIELEAGLSACIPLRAHGLTLGVITIFDSPDSAAAPHGLELRMLALLVKQGGTALLTCQLMAALHTLQTVAA